MRYPFVLFDVGGTLLAPSVSYGSVYAHELGALGIELDAERLERAIRETSQAVSRRVAPGVDRFGQYPGGDSAFWLRFIDDVLRLATGAAADPALVRRALDRLWHAFGRAATWRVHDDAVPALEALGRDGVRLGVVSNWDSRLPGLLGTLGLARHFEALAVSHLEGVEKPDPALFRRVLERLGAEPGQALHVGDAAELDVAGAGAAGVAAVLVDRAPGNEPRPGVIRDLRELVRLARHGLA